MWKFNSTTIRDKNSTFNTPNPQPRTGEPCGSLSGDNAKWLLKSKPRLKHLIGCLNLISQTLVSPFIPKFLEVLTEEKHMIWLVLY